MVEKYNPARRYAELDRQEAAQLAGQPASGQPAPPASPQPPAPVEVPSLVPPVVPTPPVATPVPIPAPPAAAQPAPVPPWAAPPQGWQQPTPATAQTTAELARLQVELAQEREARQRMEVERDKLAAQRQETEKALAEMAAARASLRAQELLKPEDWQLQHLDAEELSRVLKPVVAGVTAQNEELHRQLTEAQSRQEAALAEMQKRLEAQRVAEQQERTNRALLAAVPDWVTLLQDPQFQAYVQQPMEPGSGISLWQVMEHNYRIGNPDYVAAKVAAFKGALQAATPTPVAQVMPATAGTVPAVAPPPAEPESDDEFEAMRMGVRKGTVSRAAFNEALQRRNKGMDPKPVLQ